VVSLSPKVNTVGGVRVKQLVVVALLAVGCHPTSPTQPPAGPSGATDVCSGFQPWESSPYVLPYPVGAAFVVNQGNCSGFGHSGFWKYGYDFTMAIGTLVTASRDGQVLYSEGRGRDGEYSPTNLVVIGHEDGTVAVYSHLTHAGALVSRGGLVRAGDAIGRSGNTGNTGGLPHLHLSVHPCAKLPGLPNGDDYSCPTIPVTFRNTSPNPEGLVAGRSYTAF
jgi:murein DD-endopeptidase MepM/ murein hydrolase activator NlpD